VLEGSCLCGAVRYAIRGALGPIVCCHCDQCRKASGSAYAMNASVPAASFSFASGEALVARFESSPGTFRCFCSRCGSPVAKLEAGRPDEVRIRLGTLDGDPGARPIGRIFVASAPWTVPADGLPRAEGAPTAEWMGDAIAAERAAR
jgi:hypothetical protein